MRTKSITLLASLVVVAFIVFLRTIVQAEDKPNDPRQMSEDFGDGILMLSVQQSAGMDSRRQSIMLNDPKLIEIGKRYFVRGRGHITKKQENDPNQSWFKGVDAAFAWDDVAEFYVMTPEQIEKYTADLEE